MLCTRKLTLNKISKYLLTGICLIFSGKSLSQSIQTYSEVSAFLSDVTFYTQKFITPASDAAVYQASSCWMSTPKTHELFEVTLGVNGNMFFVPQVGRNFQIKNSDFSFFTIENQIEATVPTALGGDSQVYLTGSLLGNKVQIKTPEGMNQEIIFYPYLQGFLALWNGFEIVGKYSTKVKLKYGDYQVYGVGVKYNISQYMPFLENSNVHLAGLLGYSNEKIGFDFVNATTSFGDFGINRIIGDVVTYQFQISASKEWKRFELMLSSITNTSDFKYYLSGNESSLPIKSLLNDKLKTLTNPNINSITEISGRYQFSKFYIQTLIAFGKFANLNFAVQYKF